MIINMEAKRKCRTLAIFSKILLEILHTLKELSTITLLTSNRFFFGLKRAPMVLEHGD
jgi:hypothetical protein